MSDVGRIGRIVGVGLGTGVLTQLGQGVLPDGWSQAANAIAPWLVVAFALGATMPDPRRAVAAGVAGLALAVVGYYGTVQLRYGYGGSTSALLFWGFGAFAGGSVYGIAGWAWRTTADPRWRAVSIGLLAAVFVAEGLYLIGILPDAAPGVAFIGVGAGVPLVLGRTARERMHGYVALVPALALGGLGYVVFLALHGLLTGVP